MKFLPENVLPSFGIYMDQTRFWVVHRREYYGPFDYQWSIDLNGIEFLYQRQKYGECCSDEEFFADLKPYRLPSRVTEVATVVLGTVVLCVFRCVTAQDRIQEISSNLKKLGLEHYTINQK